MANWWESDPIVAPKKAGAAANWWESDPISKRGTPVPEARPEEKPVGKSPIGRGMPSRANMFRPEKVEQAPIPPTEEELKKSALSGRTVEQMRAGAAAEEIPQTGDFRPVTGREGTQATYNRLYDLLGGILTPEQSAAAKQARVQPLTEAAEAASAAVPLAREKQERAMQFKDENGVPLIDKVNQLMQIRDTTTDPQEQIRAQSQIRDIVRNAPVEFRNLLVDLEGQLEERAIAARAAEVAAKNAPAPTQTFARSAAETVGQTGGQQIASTISAAQRVILSPISLIEAVTGQPPNMSREIDKQAKSISDALTGEFKPDEAQMNDLGMKIVSGLTSTGMFAATGPVGAGLRLSRPVSIAIAGALPEAEQGWQEAQRRAEEDPTVDQEWRKWWSFTNRAVTGGTEAIPISRLFSRLEQASGGSLTRAVGIMAANGGEEMVQQGLQDILNNANSILLLKDPNVTIDKDVADNMIVAGLTGALFAGGAVSVQNFAQLRDVYKTPEEAPFIIRDVLFPKEPTEGEAEAEAAVAAEPGTAPKAPAAPVAAKQAKQTQDEILADVAMLKASGRAVDDIAMMSERQRKAQAKKIREEQKLQPAALTEEEIQYFTPEPEAPVAPPSPAPAVEAQGPEGVSPPPSVPPAAPSEIATDLVQQGVPPLEAMQRAAEQRQAAPQPVPVAEPLPSVTPVVEPELAAKAPKAAAAPVPFSAPEAKKAIDTAATGKPFKATLIRGQGATESPYNQFGANEPILGQGRYTTYDTEFASIFGPNVTEHDVSLQNPLVISSNAQWRALTKSAGWDFPNPFGTKIERVSQNIKNLRKMLVDQGYDGVIVRIPENEIDTAIAKVFGADQVVEFNAKKPAVVEKPVVAEKPAPAAKAAPAKAETPKKGGPRPFWRAGNMDTAIRNMGGIKDVGGELKARDVPRQLINNKRGRPLEEVALDLIERGYYPEFKVQLDNVRENSPDSYQPTPEMIEQIKNDIGKKKMHPSYQEDIEEARRLDEEKNIFGPYVEEAEKAAVALGIGKDDPMVRQAAQMVYNGQFENAEDAFRALLFTQIEDALPMEDLPELREAFGEENLADIEEFLALEGIAPLEADYVPEPSPVQEGRPVSGKGREQGVEPESEVAPEISGREVARPVSKQAEKLAEILGGFIRQDVSLRTLPTKEGTDILYDGEKIAEVKGNVTQEKVLKALLEKMLDAYKADGAVIPRNPQDMTLDEFTIAAALNRMIPEFEIEAADFDKVLKIGPGKTFTVDYRGLYNKILEQEKIGKASEDIGPEGKPQLVLPGAEKISTKKQLEQKAAAPLKAKAKQKEPGPLFGQEHLQQDLFASVAPKREAKPAAEQKPEKRQVPNWLKETSKNVGLKPVFGNDEIGIAYRSDDRGVIEYIGLHRKSDSRTRVDIDLYTGYMFTDAELAMLRDAKKREEEWSKEEIKKNPAGPFKNSNVVVSKNFPSRLGKVALEWLKIANLPPNVRVMFATEADAYDMDFAGDYRIISSPKTFMTPNTNGIKVAPKINKGVPLTIDRDYNLIILKDDMPITQTLEVLSHEIGHIIEDEVWKNTNDAMKQAVIDAHDAWAKKALKGKISDLFSGRPYKGQSELLKKYKNLLYDPADIAGNQEYWLSFSEWFADNTARWFMSEAKPLTVVDRFFKRLADALRKFYSKITNQKYAPDPDFKKWLDNYVKAESYDLVRDPQAVSPETIARQQRNTLDRSPTPTYTVPEDGFGAQLLYGIVDKYIDSSRVQRAMEAARGSPLPEDLDIEMSIQLMQDKAIAKQNKFYDADVRPMVAFMQTHKISGPEAGRFFYAQHAPERNARMAQRDPSRFDGTNGSGLTTQEALDYLASIPAERRALLDELYQKHLKPILLADLEYRADNGLLTDEQFEAYTKPFDQGGYDFYVPLQGYAEDGSDLEPVEADPFIPNIGKGFAVWGQEFKIAAGRKSVAQNPLYSSIQKRMDGIVRVEKNNTDQVLYNLIKDNPNPELATLHTEKNLPTRAVLRADGTIQRVPNFALARAEETLPLKIGGQQVYIVFNRNNPTSKRLVRSLKSLTGDEMTIAGRALLATGRFMSNINTQWVPDFFITNMPRDVQDALISIYSTKDGFATNFLKEFMRSGNIVRKVAMGQTLSVEEKQHYDEWVESGGRLDFGGFATVERTAKKLEDEFGDLFDKGRTDMETLKRYFEKSGKVTLGAIEKFNQMFDDVVRFSVYRAARSDPNNQFSPSKAAQLARRATVDFRQRGEKMPFVNALYPYLSAGINGQRNFIRVLRSKRGQKALATLVLMGIANSMLGVALSEDDETDPTKKKFYTQISDWERAKSFIIPIPINGKYRKISLGFMGLFAFGLGDQVVGYMTGNVKFQDATINVGTSLLSSFVPFWSGGFVDSITPWLFQPGIELITNKNWLGNPIYPDRDTRMPRSSQSFASTPDWAKSAAEFANDWSNGSYTEPGWVDAYPAVLEYFAKFMTQGVGTFAVASFEPFRALMNGESLEAEKLPFMRRTTVSGTSERAAYYKMRNDVKAGVAQARDVAKIIRDPKASPERKADAQATMSNLTKELGIYLTPDGVKVKYTVADSFDKADERLKNLNQEIKDVQQNDSLTTEQKGEQIKAKEQAKKDIMNSARKRYIDRNKPPPSPIDELKGLLE